MSSTDLPAPSAAGPHTVLVVEPDVRLRTAVADYLRQCGFTVVEAGDGDEALTFLESGPRIDIVFSEVAIGGTHDGFGLARRAREMLPRIKVILASGTAGAAREAAELCDDHKLLAKPYGHAELARRIRMLLSE